MQLITYPLNSLGDPIGGEKVGFEVTQVKQHVIVHGSLPFMADVGWSPIKWRIATCFGSSSLSIFHRQ
jgi:hypothetical protein